jgi:hypothetical protein
MTDTTHHLFWQPKNLENPAAYAFLNLIHWLNDRFDNPFELFQQSSSWLNQPDTTPKTQNLDTQLQAHLQDIKPKLALWLHLYENFRIGLQLGYQNIQQTLFNAGETLPIDANNTSTDILWNWGYWSQLSVNLLNNFEQKLTFPLSEIQNNASAFLAYIETQYQESAAQILAERFAEISQHLTMSQALEDLIRQPAQISRMFETYLWAQYILAKGIGCPKYPLIQFLSSSRVAPNPEIKERLKTLQVIQSDQLQQEIRPSDIDSLAHLQSWAKDQIKNQTQTHHHLWDKIDSKMD